MCEKLINDTILFHRKYLLQTFSQFHNLFEKLGRTLKCSMKSAQKIFVLLKTLQDYLNKLKFYELSNLAFFKLFKLKSKFFSVKKQNMFKFLF